MVHKSVWNIHPFINENYCLYGWIFIALQYGIKPRSVYSCSALPISVPKFVLVKILFRTLFYMLLL